MWIVDRYTAQLTHTIRVSLIEQLIIFNVIKSVWGRDGPRDTVLINVPGWSNFDYVVLGIKVIASFSYLYFPQNYPRPTR